MTESKVAIRFGTTGDAQIINTLKTMGATGDAEFDRIKNAAVRSFGRAGEAFEDAEAKAKHFQQTVNKLEILMPGLNPAKLDASAGVFEGVRRNAEDAGKTFEIYFAKMEARTRGLLSAIDPLYAAQLQYNRTIAEAKTLLDAETLSQERYEQVVRSATAALDEQRLAADRRAQAVARQSTLVLENGAGINLSGKSADDSGSVFASHFADLEKRANALRAAIDPVNAAQQRFNAEMAEARTLIGAGEISLDEYVAKLRQEQGALDQVRTAQGRAGTSAEAHRAAMQGLSYQAQDVFTQLSMGANPLQVIAIQGAQAAGQMANMGGKAGAVATVLAGPWGLAISGGMLLLAALTKGISENSDALEDAVDKLRKDARETETARQAKILFGHSYEAVSAAIRDNTDATRKMIEAEKTAAEQANIAAKNNYNEVISIRAKTQARLADAKAALEAQITNAQAPGQRGDVAALGIGRYQAQVTKIASDLAAQESKVGEARTALEQSRLALAAERAKSKVGDESDPIARVNRLYDDQVAALNATKAAALARGAVVGAASQREFEQIERNRQVALKAEQDKQAALKKTVQEYGREVTSSQASAIARAADLQVNSADRSTARQTQLYNSWISAGKPSENPVAKPGTSAHERGNALDIQMSAGVTVQKIRDAFSAEGVRLTKVFAETGHWHIEWARTAQQRTVESDAAKATRDLATANRELDSDLSDVTKRFDPVKAAANDYAETLAKIDRLMGAGRITLAEGSSMKMTAVFEENERRAAAQAESFKKIMGISGDDYISTSVADYERDRDARMTAGEEVLSREKQKREDGIRSAASLYRTLMTRGVDDVWDRFKMAGIEVIAQVLAQLTTKGGDKVTLSSIAELFGKNFSGPAYATGTEYASGGMALVGENGPELLNIPRGSQVKPAATTRQVLAANDGGVVIHFAPILNAQGAGPREVDALRAEMEQMREEIPGVIVATVQDAKGRRMLR